MTTHQGLVIRWSARLDATLSNNQLTVLGKNSSAVLSMPTSADEWTLDVGDHHYDYSGSPTAAQLLLARVEREVRGERPSPTWEDACRSLEMTDLLEVSCRRGKVIELHEEEVSEDSTFKSLMAAVVV